MDFKGIQILFFTASVILLVLILGVRRRGRIGAPFLVLWILFWSSVAVLSLFPFAINPLVPVLGLTSVKSVVYSVAILVLFLISTVLFVQLGSLRTSLVSVVSQNALSEARMGASEVSAVEGSDGVAVVIPARNEEGTIAGVVREVRGLELGDAVVLVVDDGSEDRTSFAASSAGARVLAHSTNLGIGAALKTGYLAASRCRVKWLVQIDADSQHSPDDIPLLLNELKTSGADLVIGSRFLGSRTGNVSSVRRAGIMFYTRLVNRLTGLHLSDVTCGMRAFSMTSLHALMFKSRGAWAIETTLRAGRAGLVVTEVPISSRERPKGASQFHDVTLFITYHFRALKQIMNVYL